jgi:hypothetical protein
MRRSRAFLFLFLVASFCTQAVVRAGDSGENSYFTRVEGGSFDSSVSANDADGDGAEAEAWIGSRANAEQRDVASFELVSSEIATPAAASTASQLLSSPAKKKKRHKRRRHTPTPTRTRTPTPTRTRTPTPTPTRTPTPAATPTASAGNWRVFAWNDLGMHCMDSDYSVFSILPPFNVLHAQVMDANGHLLTSGAAASLTYEAIADPNGSINRSSIGKTNFWNYTPAYFGVAIPPDLGVAGFAMPGMSNLPQAMSFISSGNDFVGLGIPITPYDDNMVRNFYPLMKVTAHDSGGNAVVSTVNVLPVSDEMNCLACHASGTVAEAMPQGGWVNDPNPERDYRLNVLLLHDQKVPDPNAYQQDLAQAGYTTAGLYQSAISGTPILCANCHLSNALAPYGITGIAGIPPLTTSVHSLHATAIDPGTGLALDDTNDRSACYQCHPGSTTQCLRGAMGSAKDAQGNLLMQCQSCHGVMSTVGSSTRQGWLDEPNCQNCHTGDAITNSGQLLFTSIFATNPNAPSSGHSLYRFSFGHGGLNCEACHGATHAVYPSSEQNDNLQSLALQGHVGMLSDCTACHTSTPSNIATGGPHGMHLIGQQWVGSHGDYADSNGTTACQNCHGGDYKGTYISRAQGDRSFSTDSGTVKFARGTLIGCYSCHNGPNPD